MSNKVHRPKRHRCLALALTLMAPATLCVPAIARADEAVLRAKGFFAEGKRLYNLGRFRDAAGNFKKAYEAKPLAPFLYNLGQCYRHLETPEDLKKSIFYYRGYLNNTPKARDRQKVEQTIAKLQNQIKELQQRVNKVEKKLQPRPDLVPASQPKPLPPAKPTPIYKKWWFWTAVGAVAVGAGLGIGFGVSSMDNKVPEGPSYSWKSFQMGGGGP